MAQYSASLGNGGLTVRPVNDHFFENEDDSNARYVRNPKSREAQRYAAEQLQIMADEMSRATADEYQEDILDHMERMEAETIPDVDSIDIQTEIQWFMRPYLLDFLIEAHIAFQLLPETLFLTVNLLDRYCSKRVVFKRHYQLVGCAAMLIAAKYGDKKDRVPTIRELQSMCCGLYEEDMFVQMERHVLQTLNWIIGHPTVDNFLQMILSEVSYDPEVEYMALYLSEIAMFHKDFVSTLPSVMARSSLALARHILGRTPPPQSDWAMSYDTTTIVLLSQHLHRPSQVLVRKYSSAHYGMVAVTLEDFMAKQAAIARRHTIAPRVRQMAPQPQIQEPENTLAPQPQASTVTPMTPQKPATGQQQQQQMPHGYPTPPETPNDDYFEHQQAMLAAKAAAGQVMVPQNPTTPLPTPTSAPVQPLAVYQY
ncbi:Cyclin-B1-2 [Dactylellina cionopaga]|nr:Cyclin-B1-2 [Dactylellina cionopaga]